MVRTSVKRRAGLLLCPPNDYCPVGPQTMGDLGGIAGVVLATIQHHSNLRVAGEGLHKMAIQIGLPSRDDDKPLFGLLPFRVLLIRSRKGLHDTDLTASSGPSRLSPINQLDRVPECRLRSRKRSYADAKRPRPGKLEKALMDKALLITLICVLCAVAFLGDPSTPMVASAQTANKLEKAAAEVVAATLKYRAALERVLAIYERDQARLAELSELRRDLFERDVLSKREFEEGQRAQVEAQKNVADTRAALADTDRMLTEARMAEAIARLTPLPRGSYQETAGLARFNGAGAWSLAVDVPRLQQFFHARFGRTLPISASGQTPLHDRMGFDHRNALDVAVHPDSPEGRALMEHLRDRGIPFIAAWGAIPGSASGAHLHVGQPSPRIEVKR